MKRLVIMASGGGTTAAAILTSVAHGQLQGMVEIVGLIASKPDIGVIHKFLGFGFAASRIYVVNPKDFASREVFGNAILKVLHNLQPDFFGQYGWIPLTPRNVVEEFKGHGINQHPGGLDPSLAGSYPDFGGKGMYGKAAIAAQLYFSRRISRKFYAEATAHLVTPDLDTGLLLANTQLPIDNRWSVDQLQQELLPLEHGTQILALKRLCERGKPYSRASRLILPHEVRLLETARRDAIADYPRG